MHTMMALQEGRSGARKIGGHFLVFQSKAAKRSLKKGYCFREPLFSVSNKVISKKIFILGMPSSWCYYEEIEQYLA